MKLLFLAPQPFFQERGTPIAVRLALQVLAERARDHGSDDRIDLLSYHEGEQVEIPGVLIHRISVPFIKNVGPGISVKKLVCDLVFLFSAFRLVLRMKPHSFDLVHAVEESVFIAWLIKLCFGVPYIYDMDSSLALQLTEKWVVLRPLQPILGWFEKMAVRSSLAVVPVCDALAVIANRHGSKDTMILPDISNLKSAEQMKEVSLRKEADLHADHKIILYVGNLEPYQGIDLLIDSFAQLSRKSINSVLVIIGGSERHVLNYKNKIRALGLTDRVKLLGPRSLDLLSEYTLQADILVSPRVRGNNTPMKIYSYLHTGKPIVATKLPTHTQVLNSQVSLLADPTPESFSNGLLTILTDSNLAAVIGKNAKSLAEERYTLPIFKRRLNELYDRIEPQVSEPQIAVIR